MSYVFWFTGLSGAGKTTLSTMLAAELRSHGTAVCVLDGDSVRNTLCTDLGFGDEDRTENIRRLASVAEIVSSQGIVVCVAAITPKHSMQQLVRAVVSNLVLVFCDVLLITAEQRDVKGLYKRARAGLLPGFTGVEADYEPPKTPDLHLDTNDSRQIAPSIQALLELATRRRTSAPCLNNTK